MDSDSRCSAIWYDTFRIPQVLIFLFLDTCLAISSHHSQLRPHTDSSAHSNRSAVLGPFLSTCWTCSDPTDTVVTLLLGMVGLTALCGTASALWIWKKRTSRPGTAASVENRKHALGAGRDDAMSTDPGLLRKYSTTRSYSAYPAIRTFYRPHPQEGKLPQKPTPLPLLVFIHGLGGSAAQFHPILISLSNLASCLAVDLPGCGLSAAKPTAWEAYTTGALVCLLAEIIEAHRDRENVQQVVLVGHSMGCSLAALLASSTSPHAELVSKHVAGMIAICPKADPPTLEQARSLRSLTMVPTFIFDVMRRWDRRGGLDSASVRRMTGSGADIETRRLQLRFNRQSRTAVWRRMALGMCPEYTSHAPTGGLPGREVWRGLDLPLFMAVGEADEVTPIENLRSIVQYLSRDGGMMPPTSNEPSLPYAAAPIDPARIDPAMSQREHHDSGVAVDALPRVSTQVKAPSSFTISTHSAPSPELHPVSSLTDSAITSATMDQIAPRSMTIPTPHPRRLVVTTAIMPKPASHSLLFAPTSSRIISGLIGNFLSEHIDPRLSLAWQLQYLSTEGKWDVKNLAKWKAVQPVSRPIAGIFRAMKTLREVDEQHSPKDFVKDWTGRLCAVVDISHDSPVYDPKGLEQSRIAYYKFPTVSKQPPSREEVRAFIELIDSIRAARHADDKVLVGVHCHYGFNRTGFFVVSYLIEKLGYSVQDAIDTFQKARPPGIRHEHFIDELHVRYCSGLRKAPTL